MQSWLDRISLFLAPRWTLRRQQARVAADLLARHYEASAAGRRTQGWKRSAGDANAAVAGGIPKIREIARDLVRNNAYAASALDTIVDHAVGWGITAAEKHDAWKRWSETTACDADGRHDFAGIQKLVMRTVVESGEVLVRRRWRRVEDGLPLPFQLQVLEPDFIDTTRDGAIGEGGGRIIQGVEFDALGRRVAYWLFREHPGAIVIGSRGYGASQRISASDIVHVFKPGRPGQVRAVSWFAPVVLRLKDFDDYEDAALMKQKIAACLAVVTSDVDGATTALGTTTSEEPEVDSLEPGMIAHFPPGRSISVVQPPTVNEHDAYAKTVLRAIATGLGVTYEDLTGDYTNLPFSAARMSRLRHWARVEDWRWRMLVPQLLDPVWGWAMQASLIMGLPVVPSTEWTAPPAAMIEPDKEGLAYSRNIRAGITTLSEVLRERGYRRDAILDEYEEDIKELRRRGIILDSDASMTTQSGQPRETARTSTPETQSLRDVTGELAAIAERLASAAPNGGHR